MIAATLLVSTLVLHAPAAKPDAAPWGPEGHRLVAELAARLLSPTARARVDSLLAGPSMAAVSNWADSIRTFLRRTAPLHYVDIPLGATTYDSAPDCPDGRTEIIWAALLCPGTARSVVAAAP